jgi:hypothetical protein
VWDGAEEIARLFAADDIVKRKRIENLHRSRSGHACLPAHATAFSRASIW